MNCLALEPNHFSSPSKYGKAIQCVQVRAKKIAVSAKREYGGPNSPNWCLQFSCQDWNDPPCHRATCLTQRRLPTPSLQSSHHGPDLGRLELEGALGRLSWVLGIAGHGSKSRTPSEHPNPHSNTLKWMVRLPQNGTSQGPATRRERRA